MAVLEPERPEEQPMSLAQAMAKFRLVKAEDLAPPPPQPVQMTEDKQMAMSALRGFVLNSIQPMLDEAGVTSVMQMPIVNLLYGFADTAYTFGFNDGSRKKE
jgi:hypothetical protein